LVKFIAGTMDLCFRSVLIMSRAVKAVSELAVVCCSTICILLVLLSFAAVLLILAFVVRLVAAVVGSHCEKAALVGINFVDLVVDLLDEVIEWISFCLTLLLGSSFCLHAYCVV
jgi:hypothetical protein